MLNFLTEYGGTIAIGAVLLVVVLLIVGKLYRDRKKGQTSCGCSCDHCPSSGACHGQKK